MITREEIARELSAGAATRHARWDARLWADVVSGPAAVLEETLRGGRDADLVLRAYLELCAEAVGLGYLFPEASGATNFLSVALRRIVPGRLQKVPPEERLSLLAQLWNLGENLEAQPFWLSRLFLRRIDALTDLRRLDALVEDVGRALEASPAPGTFFDRLRWVDLGAEDRRFLPGAMHFITPPVLCVHDRLRTGGGGRRPDTLGVWLGGEPMLLGAMGCDGSPTAASQASLELSSAQRRDARIDEVFATARGEAGLAVALRTSQLLVLVLP